jgi:ADP-ribose pyrophosphatase
LARVEHPPSVVLVVTDEDQLVLVRQYRPGAGRPVVELPAGKLEPGESPVAAAARELAEECGLAASGWRTLGSFWAAPAYSTEYVTALAATVDGLASAPPDADEQIEVLRVPAAEAGSYLEEATSLAALALHRKELPA